MVGRETVTMKLQNMRCECIRLIYQVLHFRAVRAGLIEGKINEKKNEIKRTDFRFSQKTAG